MPNRANGHYFSLAWLLTNRKNIFANRVVKSPGLLGEGRSMVKYTKLTWRTSEQHLDGGRALAAEDSEARRSHGLKML